MHGSPAGLVDNHRGVGVESFGNGARSRDGVLARLAESMAGCHGPFKARKNTFGNVLAVGVDFVRAGKRHGTLDFIRTLRGDILTVLSQAVQLLDAMLAMLLEVRVARAAVLLLVQLFQRRQDRMRKALRNVIHDTPHQMVHIVVHLMSKLHRIVELLGVERHIRPMK